LADAAAAAVPLAAPHARPPARLPDPPLAAAHKSGRKPPSPSGARDSSAAGPLGLAAVHLHAHTFGAPHRLLALAASRATTSAATSPREMGEEDGELAPTALQAACTEEARA
ncbi:g5766, partial [Coccomyxa elongata]